MKTRTRPPARFAGCFSADEVFGICKRLVYPPCRKLAATIRVEDRLASDLGYVGDAANLLASKTNEAFQMVAPGNFSRMDFCAVQTVQEHVLAICKKLAREGRLITEAAGHAPAEAARAA